MQSPLTILFGGGGRAPFGQLGGQPATVKIVTVVATVAQVRNVVNVPIPLLPAPGAGQILLPLCCYFHTTQGVAFSGSMTLNLHWVGIATALQGNIGSVTNSAGERTAFVNSIALGLNAGTTYSNRGLQVQATVGPLTGGDAPVQFTLAYLVVGNAA